MAVIGWTQYQGDAAVWVGLRGMGVQRNTLVAIIERFHPVVINLNIPGFARWNVADLYQQGFIGQQLK